MFLIMAYGTWGSELQDTADTVEEAKSKALAASVKSPENEFCVEIEPGDCANPLYKNGEQIQ